MFMFRSHQSYWDENLFSHCVYALKPPEKPSLIAFLLGFVRLFWRIEFSISFLRFDFFLSVLRTDIL